MHDLANVGSVAVIAAMVPEIRPTIRTLSLARVGGATDPTWKGQAADRQVVAAVTSMGTVAASAVTGRILDDHAVDWVIAIGICGAIDPGLEIGDLIVPESTLDESAEREGHPIPLAGHRAAGRILTTDQLYTDPATITALRDRGFTAVDMETGAIGRVCEARGVPWSVFRAVSDRAGDPGVDADVVGMAKPDGTADVRAVVRYVHRHAHRVPKMVELGRGMRAAVSASTAATLSALRE